ncbi:7-carboxy-7-deazaguanine synthase QueE [Ectothiorhodospira haloalkaliphila]|uniref:7-carboxy-7-deazaguanine synthase QueE n=1 Tax=Ectothiorhodospira haloalkaliphila TaxID=421628 RepID=UPI001EE962C6|nr:7-carboxy-7-deazaguanine synthase QueE [Ectothiorhodospira haloalkaliphila]MCG5523388.1 7-carboxy-7-deazaguanine synthase QueE [Ectothiorhodospira haloalkaliphila]
MNTPSLESAPPAPINLRITEIFLSLQGESRSVGWPTVFIRLTGCPLRCGYCDTAYAFTGGRVMPLEDILARVQGYGVHHVCVTGGEPLAQPACLPLLAALCDAGHEVSLETSGALDVSAVDPRAIKVMDLKTPGSGEVARNRWENLDHLSSHDQVKFVICDRADYDWAREVVSRYGLADRVEVLFSVAFGDLAPGTLADWIVEDHLPVRFQLQLHKVLWNDARGR